MPGPPAGTRSRYELVSSLDHGLVKRNRGADPITEVGSMPQLGSDSLVAQRARRGPTRFGGLT